MLNCEYVGNLHVHSWYSDGTGSIYQIAQAARETSIDFVGINDHHTLGAKQDGLEGWHEDVLILVGMENNHKYNHYISYGVELVVPDNTEHPQVVIDAVNKQGGIGFLAHPFEKGSRFVFGGHAYTWEDWQITGFTGISIWNYSSQWRDGISNIPVALWQAYVAPHRAITGPCPRALAKLDQLAQKRKVVAIGATDAHAVNVQYGPFKRCIFPYEFLFRTVNTHVLLDGELEQRLVLDKDRIYKALGNGQCFVAFDYYQSARGFRYWAEKGRELANMGEERSYEPGWRLKAVLPFKGQISLIRNGEKVFQDYGKEMNYRVKESGAYRVEVTMKNKLMIKPWIYSNYIYFR